MPLAFTQDFLVAHALVIFLSVSNFRCISRTKLKRSKKYPILNTLYCYFSEMVDINRLQEIPLETSKESHKTRKAWIPTHYAHGIVALNHLGATEERIKEFIQW